MNRRLKLITGIIVSILLLMAALFCYLTWKTSAEIESANDAIKEGLKHSQAENPGFQYKPFEKAKPGKTTRRSSDDSSERRKLQEDMQRFSDSLKNASQKK